MDSLGSNGGQIPNNHFRNDQVYIEEKSNQMWNSNWSVALECLISFKNLLQVDVLSIWLSFFWTFWPKLKHKNLYLKDENARNIEKLGITVGHKFNWRWSQLRRERRIQKKNDKDDG